MDQLEILLESGVGSAFERCVVEVREPNAEVDSAAIARAYRIDGSTFSPRYIDGKQGAEIGHPCSMGTSATAASPARRAERPNSSLSCWANVWLALVMWDLQLAIHQYD